jgi:hypothetical protein
MMITLKLREEGVVLRVDFVGVHAHAPRNRPREAVFRQRLGSANPVIYEPSPLS